MTEIKESKAAKGFMVEGKLQSSERGATASLAQNAKNKNRTWQVVTWVSSFSQFTIHGSGLISFFAIVQHVQGGC